MGELTQEKPRKLTLTKSARTDLFAGGAPKITGDKDTKCPVSEGYVYMLAPDFWFEVTAVRRTRAGGWSLAYHIYDLRHRAALLRRTPPVHVEEAALLAPTSGEIDKARVESSYTSNVKAAVSGAGESMDVERPGEAKRRADLERRRRRLDQANLSLERKAKAYQEEAARRRIPIRDEVRAMRRSMTRPAEFEKRLEDVRRRLDSDLDRAA